MTTPLSITPELMGANLAAWLCRDSDVLIDPITGARHTDPDQLSTRTFDACLTHARANGLNLVFYTRNLNLPPIPLIILNQDLVLPPDTSLTQEQAQATVDEAARLVRSLQHQHQADLTVQTVQTSQQWALTETGNAERFAYQHGTNVRYCWEWKKWLVWDGTRWKLDSGACVMSLAKQTIRSIYTEAAQAKDDKATAIAKHAIRSEKENARLALLALAQSEDGIPITPDELDQHPWLLNCSNVTLDLRTGEAAPHNREDRITKRVKINYDPKATCPRWLAFLDRIFTSDQDLISFMQRSLGYSLTGITREQCFFILHGTGSNGKSTLINTLLALLGHDYAKQAAPELLLLKNHSTHPTELADLHGARLVATIETGDGRQLAENLVKQMTGEDHMKARRMREDFWEFVPEFKLWLATNHRPEIRGTDYAIWRRIRLIPFNVTIPDTEKDSALPDKLKAELPGILNWSLQGCLDWQQHGLQPPEAVVTATTTYQQDMDVLAAFLADCCVIDPDTKAKASTLYQAYCDWSQQNGEHVENQRRFGQRLVERGFEKKRITTGWHYMGIGLQTADYEPMNHYEPISDINKSYDDVRGLYRKKVHEGS